MEINPIHLRYTSQQSNLTESVDIGPKQFVDPRTGVEIPSHECNYKSIELETTNIFLKHHIQTSKLNKHEHSACLNALGSLAKSESELSMEERQDRTLYESTAIQRSEEKDLFLKELQKHYFAKIHTRYHNVPPAINYFVTNIWKRRLIGMYRQVANRKYQIRTAISLQHSKCNFVKAINVHQEQFGNVPEMTNENIPHLWQSSTNLAHAYNLRKSTHLASAIKEKFEWLIREHGVDIVAPTSVLKVLLGVKKEWAFRMSIEESASSTSFDPKKKIVFEKPLPPTYLSGNDRYKKGAKYLLHSCLNQHSLHVYNHNQQTEVKTTVDTEAIDCSSGTQADVEYKIENCDEFIRAHPKIETSYANMTFTIFDVTGSADCDSMDDANETFKVLVPAKQAAYVKDANGDYQFINYCPKIEFQPEYGAEVMTKEELISEWCDLYFRPDTNNVRGMFIDCE